VDDVGARITGMPRRLFGGDLLDPAAQLGAHAIEQRADLALAHLLQHLVGIAHVGFRVHVRANGRTMSAKTPSWPTFSSTVIWAMRDSMRSEATSSP
jgi:hypothetical protein